MSTAIRFARWLPAISLAACGGGGSTDIKSTLVFADRTDAEIARIINAGTGSEMFQAQGQVDQFGSPDPFNPDPCPAIAIDGDTATVTGGCTTMDGVMIGGSAVVTNPFSWDQIDGTYGTDATYRMEALSFIQSGFTQSYDGSLVVAGDFTSWDADITTESFGVQLRSDLYIECSGTQGSVSCEVSGSGIELIGVGGATVSGSQHINGQTLTADYRFRGADTLIVNINAQRCISWRIDGTDRRSMQVCAP